MIGSYNWKKTGKPTETKGGCLPGAGDWEEVESDRQGGFLCTMTKMFLN